MQSAVPPVTTNDENHPPKGPQIRDVPDSLDDVYIPRGITNMRGNSTTSWRNPHYNQRPQNPYRRNNLRPPGPGMAYPGPMDSTRHDNFQMLPMNQPVNFPPPANNNFMPDLLPQHIQPYRPELGPNIHQPPYKQPNYNPPFDSVSRLEPSFMNEDTLNQPSPLISKHTDSKNSGDNRPPVLHPEQRAHSAVLNLPPPGLTGKKVLINPHFKGNLQSLEGHISNIDDAAERFIAEQRSALARAATRPRRSPPDRFPPRYLAKSESDPESVDYARYKDEELLRRQEEFINRNRAGLRRRMRSPTPPRRSSPNRRAPATQYQPPNTPETEANEYKRKVREQENMRERVMRAKEVRRRKNAVAAQKQVTDKEKEDPVKSDKDGAIVPQKNIDSKEIKANVKSEDFPQNNPLQSTAGVKSKGESKKESEIVSKPVETTKAIIHTAPEKVSVTSEVPKLIEAGNKTAEIASKPAEISPKPAEISPKPADPSRKRPSSSSKKITEKKNKFEDGDRMTPPLPMPPQLQKETPKAVNKPLIKNSNNNQSSDLSTEKVETLKAQAITVEVSKPKTSKVKVVKTKAANVGTKKPQKGKVGTPKAQASKVEASKPVASKMEVTTLPSANIESSKPEETHVNVMKLPSSKGEASHQLATKVEQLKSEAITKEGSELAELKYETKTSGVKRSLLYEDDDNDALDLILNEIDDILSDSEGSDRYKELPRRKKSSKKGNSSSDSSSQPPPSKSTDSPQRQKVMFPDDKKEAKQTVPTQLKKKDLTPPRLSEKPATPVVTREQNIKVPELTKEAPKRERMKIVFDKKDEVVQVKPKDSFPVRRVVLKRSAEIKTQEKTINLRSVVKSQPRGNPSVPNIGIFSRAVKTALGNSAVEAIRASTTTLSVVKKVKPALGRQASVEPNLDAETDTDDESLDEELLLRDEDEEPLVALVSNLPHGMTDTRMTNLAGNEVQKLKLDKEQRSAQITFKTTIAAETFKKKFNNKMVAASRLTVVLR